MSDYLTIPKELNRRSCSYCGGLILEQGQACSHNSREAILYAYQTAVQERDRLKEQLSPTLEALEKLSKLGNEPMLGNSDGNIIAQEALATLKEII